RREPLILNPDNKFQDPLTLSLSPKGGKDAAARSACTSPPYPLADMASLYGKLTKASLLGEGQDEGGLGKCCAGRLRGVYAWRSVKQRASLTKSAGVSLSARCDGSIPARLSSGTVSTPSAARLERSILRRWPKAAAVTLSRCDTGTAS